jgi:hypothetical protein
MTKTLTFDNQFSTYKDFLHTLLLFYFEDFLCPKEHETHCCQVTLQNKQDMPLNRLSSKLVLRH